MFKKTVLAATALAMGVGTFVPVGEADAQRRYRNQPTYNQGYYNGRRDVRRAQKCKDGDGGLLIGAIAGGLLGRTVDTRGDRTMGTLLGAGAGALAGRAIDRSDRPGYCRR
jgi:outer membrane lipoprotein SlyB